MNDDIMEAADMLSAGAILDLLPILFNFKFILSSTHEHLEKTSKYINTLFQKKIDEARVWKG